MYKNKKMTRKNLVYSLPDVLMIKVYEFDTTYRIFNKAEFKKELTQAYFKLPSIQKRCINEITDYLSSIIDEECQWHNEYGRIDPDNIYNQNIVKYESIDEFFIYVQPFEDILYYKILPKRNTNSNSKFLNNPSKFDGFFCEREKNETLLDSGVKTKYDLLHNVCSIFTFNNLMECKDTKICMWF